MGGHKTQMFSKLQLLDISLQYQYSHIRTVFLHHINLLSANQLWNTPGCCWDKPRKGVFRAVWKWTRFHCSSHNSLCFPLQIQKYYSVTQPAHYGSQEQFLSHLKASVYIKEPPRRVLHTSDPLLTELTLLEKLEPIIGISFSIMHGVALHTYQRTVQKVFSLIEIKPFQFHRECLYP